MIIDYIQTLPILQELYEQPRDFARFEWYLKQMLGENEAGETDVVMPITAVNPMGRDNCLAAIKTLRALEADDIAQAAFLEAATAFSDVDQQVRVAINLVDDVGGAWSNRYVMEAGERLLVDEKRLAAWEKRPFVMLPCWTSERYTAEKLVEEARAALYRYGFAQRHGVVQTLGELMRLDGEARAFAGAAVTLDADELAYTAELIEPFLPSTDYPVQVACLFGDEAAKELGYEPQGFAAYAGFELALGQALQQQQD